MFTTLIWWWLQYQPNLNFKFIKSDKSKYKNQIYFKRIIFFNTSYIQKETQWVYCGQSADILKKE